MPLRYVRKRLTAENALSVAVATASVTRELSDLLQCPPARAAAGLLLLIFETIQEIQTNRTECYHLGRRCLTLLTDIRDAMQDRWEDAPEALLRNVARFEKTLQALYDDLKKEAEHKWHSRLMRKNTIETILKEYNVQLDDASRSFQIATLVNIHYTVGDRSASTSKKTMKAIEDRTTSIGSVPAPPYIEREGSVDAGLICESPTSARGSNGSLTFSDAEILSFATSRSSSDDFSLVSEPSSQSLLPLIEHAVPAAITCEAEDMTNIQDELETLEDRGFRRYHQSDVVLKGPSRIKSGWWAGAREVEVEGRKLLMLRYEGHAKRWIRDVKTLQNLYHPNLPQMIGYSGTDVPTPFILLANVQTRLPQAMVLDALKNSSLLDCARLLIRFYKETFDAALYIQRQLGLTESQTQNYVEDASFRIEGIDTLVMGLPPPESLHRECYRNFGLAWSIRDMFIQLLPNRGHARLPFDPKADGDECVQRRANHLGLLLKSIFPGSDEVEVASTRLRQLTADQEDEEAEPLSLSMIRMVAIEGRTHGHAWSNNFVQPWWFNLGDIGYVPEGGDFNSFVSVKNALNEGWLQDENVQQLVNGEKTYLEGAHFNREELQAFELPGDVHGWPLLLNAGTRQKVQAVHERSFKVVSEAWKVLLKHGRELARTHNIRPDQLMLVTCAGVDQRFNVHDLRHVPLTPHNSAHQHPMQRVGFPQFGGGRGHNFHHQHHNPHAMMSFNQPPPPAVLYLFTSLHKEHEPLIMDTPAYIPPALQPKRPELRAKCVWGQEGTYGFMKYVQLHEEDFDA